MSNTTKSQVNPNFQIPKRKDKQKGGAKLVVLGFEICLVVLVCIGILDFLWS
jgi:hypothetical protein